MDIGRFGNAVNFNPRSPCGERLWALLITEPVARFQSTLPVWGATKHGETFYMGVYISIHAPRVGSD